MIVLSIILLVLKVLPIVVPSHQIQQIGVVILMVNVERKQRLIVTPCRALRMATAPGTTMLVPIV